MDSIQTPGVPRSSSFQFYRFDTFGVPVTLNEQSDVHVLSYSVYWVYVLNWENSLSIILNQTSIINPKPFPNE